MALAPEIPIYVIHVASDLQRQRHIDAMMQRMGLPFSYILEGDMAQLSPEVLDRFFAGEMRRVSPATSCAYKHLLACRQIVERGLPGAVVLEDDIMLYPRFRRVVEKGVAELMEKADFPAIVSFEETRLRYVERSRRQPGRVLYRGDRDRFAGALYVNRAAARLLVEVAQGQHVDRPIDLLHRQLAREGRLHYYWSAPCVARQRRSFPSLIDIGKGGHGALWQGLLWHLRRAWRRLLYGLR